MQDGWAPVSQAAVAAPLSKGQQPQPGNNNMAALYFVGYIVAISFIVLQLVCVNAEAACKTALKPQSLL